MLHLLRHLARRLNRHAARHLDQPHIFTACLHCGAPSATRVCASCAQALWESMPDVRQREAPPSAALIVHIAEQPTQPILRIVAPHDQVHQVDRAALVDATPAPASEDDLPFPDGDGYPDLAAPMYLLGEVDGIPSVIRLGCADEFSEDVVRVRLARETLPPLREDWSSRCPWCAREMRELGDDTITHWPQRATITTCPRHHAAALALNADLRSGAWQTRFDDAHGGDASHD